MLPRLYDPMPPEPQKPEPPENRQAGVGLGVCCGIALRVPWFAIGAACVLAVVAAFGAERDTYPRLAAKYQAKIEVRTPDGARCDLVTATHAIEVDYPKKWAESIGQALYYALALDRKPGVILLADDPQGESKRIARCRRVCERYDITLWIEPESPPRK